MISSKDATVIDSFSELPQCFAILEDIAIQYVNQTDGSLRLISVGFTILGAIVAAAFHKSSGGLKRVPYFAFSSILFFVAAVSQLVWLGSIQAFTSGFLWAFMLVDAVVGVSVGYAYCAIAMARSRDAYGHARMAFLAFIPIVNLWLLLTASKRNSAVNCAPTVALLTGVWGVLTGFVLIFGGLAVGVFIQVEMNRMVVAFAECLRLD